MRTSDERPLESILFRMVPVFLLSALMISGCGGSQDTAEEHRKLSLRLEHRPPGSVPAGQEVEIRALVRSSLENARLQAWLRLVGDGEDVRIPMTLEDGGEARGTIPGHERGDVLRYVIEARDAEAAEEHWREHLLIDADKWDPGRRPTTREPGRQRRLSR